MTKFQLFPLKVQVPKSEQWLNRDTLTEIRALITQDFMPWS